MRVVILSRDLTNAVLRLFGKRCNDGDIPWCIAKDAYGKENELLDSPEKTAGG